MAARYSREELIRASGARPEDLAEMERLRLLVVCRDRRLFGRGEDYYTEGQLAAVKWFAKARRATERSRGRASLTDSSSADRL